MYTACLLFEFLKRLLRSGTVDPSNGDPSGRTKFMLGGLGYGRTNAADGGLGHCVEYKTSC